MEKDMEAVTEPVTTETVRKARLFALRVHDGQFYPPPRPGEWGLEQKNPPVLLPFHLHLGNVQGALLRFIREVPPLLAAAAWLHDALEDTPTHADEIAGEVHPDVARVVFSVTDAAGDFPNRAARKRATYPKIVDEGPGAIAVKLADRIANVEASLLGHLSFRFYKMYQSEYPEFRDALFPHGGPLPMWNHLDYLLGRNVVQP